MSVLSVITAGLIVAGSTDPKATALIDTAIARMGGQAVLEQITRLKVEVMTEWQRHTLDDRLSTPVSSYERDTELRDYSIPAWRYTRRFQTAVGPAGTAVGVAETIDLVTDSVAAIRISTGAWRALSVAYVDERNELFMASADRILILARRAIDATVLADTNISGARYARVRLTIGTTPATLYFQRATGMLAITQLKAAQERDFGLAPWGTMDVQFRYSRWNKNPQTGLALPLQTDVYRVGKPYKRMTWLSMQVNPEIPADSFAMADSLRASFLATQNRAMYDLPMDTAKIVEGKFAVFGTPGTPVGAVKLGGSWVIFETGIAPMSAERSHAFLDNAEPKTPIAFALITMQSGAGSGGAAHFAKRGIPIRVTNGARPYAEASIEGWNGRKSSLMQAVDGRWIRIGNDSLIVESLDLPDAPRSAVVYVPSLKWLYLSSLGLLQRDLAVAYARRRGWVFDWIAAPGITIVGQPAPK